MSACNISGAYLNAPCGGNIRFVADAEAGTNKGKAMVVTRALYGLKTSAKAWRSFFGISLGQMGYKLCPADPDVYM